MYSQDFTVQVSKFQFVSSSLAYLKVLDFLGEHFNEMVGSDMVRDLAGWLCDLGKMSTHGRQ